MSKSLTLFKSIRIAAAGLILLAGCSSPQAPAPTTPAPANPPPDAYTRPATTPPEVKPTTPAVPKPSNPELILSSTTSVRDTGLMDVLLPMFEAQTGYKVKPIYNGSGQAIALAQAGGGGGVIVHWPRS